MFKMSEQLGPKSIGPGKPGPKDRLISWMVDNFQKNKSEADYEQAVFSMS
jgi:hypothetical protein